MKDYNTLVALLQEMAADQLGQYQRYGCYGCGHEHNCSAEGCAILREALATMEQLYKDVTGNCLTCTYSDVPSDQEPCKSYFDGPNPECCHWQWQGVQEEGKDNG